MQLWNKDQSGHTVAELVSKMVKEKSKNIRHDWSDDQDFANESLMENDMKSIVS